MYYPADQNAIQVAEVRGHHHDGSFLCKASQHVHFPNYVDFVAKSILVAEVCAKFFYARSVQKSYEPEFDDLTGKLVGAWLKVAGDLRCVAMDNFAQEFFFLFAGFF